MRARRRSARRGPECDRAYPRFLEFVPESAPEDGLVDLGCIASVGTAGCGFEQPLEAMLKALAPSTARDRGGGRLRDHAGGPAPRRALRSHQGPQLVPSCNVPGMGAAFPPRRLLQVGEALEQMGARTVATSLCTDDFTGAFDAILARIAQSVSGTCR